MTIRRARAEAAAASYRARLAARRRMLAPLALFIAAACSSTNPKAPAEEGDPVPSLDAGVARQWQPRPALSLSLRLLNPRLRQGDTLKLESTIRNISNAPVPVTHVVCELDLEGELQTMAPLILCFAYSASTTLGPGDQIIGRLERVVSSPPGVYTISVRHLLEPGVSVPAQLTVHP